MLGFIWAEDLDGNIGYQGKLPWYLSADLKHFKQKTIGHSIIMGRKTFAGLPKILPQRLHIVLTTNKELREKYKNSKKVEIFNNIVQLQKWLKKQKDSISWIIGGKSLFFEFKEQVDILERTVIHAHLKGDVKMPKIDYSKFELINEDNYIDKNSKYDYTFLTYKKRASKS